MSETIRELGEAVTFALSVIDRDTPANNPVTGEAPTIAIRRLSDDYWYDFVAGTWGAVVGGYAGLAADNTAAMTDKADGTYEYDWDQDTADGGATRSYEAVYEIAAGTYRSMAYEIWVFRSVATAGGLALEATLTAIKGAGWTVETLQTIYDAVIAAGSGSGANAVALTLNDGDGDPVANALCIVRNAAESTVLGIDTTDSLGQVHFQLDDGSYKITFGPSSTLAFSNPYALTVSGDTAATYACTALSIPPTAGASNVVLFNYERKVEADAAFGASDVTVKILSVSVAALTDATANAQRSVEGTEYTTDTSGLWSFQVADVLDDAVLTLQKSYTNAAETVVTERWSAKIDTALAEDGQLAWADLGPERA